MNRVAIIVALLTGALAWGVIHYRDNAIEYKKQRDKVTEQLSLANATITDMTTRQRDVAALDAKYTKELADAKKTISNLRRDVDSGAKRLRIAATCHRCKKPPPPPAWMMQEPRTYSRRSTELFRSPGRNRNR